MVEYSLGWVRELAVETGQSDHRDHEERNTEKCGDGGVKIVRKENGQHRQSIMTK